MPSNCLNRLLRFALGLGVVLALPATRTRAADVETTELIRLIEEQDKEIQDLKRRVDARAARTELQRTAALSGNPAAPPGPTVISEDSIQRIVADYLQANPGAGMPPSVGIGYYSGQGFAIRSTPNPSFTNWQDEAKVPFDLRIRGRIQTDYYFYKVTDNYNHLTQTLTYPNAKTPATGGTNPTGLLGANSAGDFSQMEIKRMRFLFEGTAFDPNLRYYIQLDGGTRGLTGISGGSGETGISNDGTSRGGGQPGGADGNSAATVDHIMRIYGIYLAYDWHPACGSPGCSCDCPDNASRYAPTVTLIAGNFKPMFAAEEVGGSGNCQFVEWGMSELMFDTDDDNYLTQAGIQVKAMEDRFYLMSCVTNMGESQFPNLENQRLPALIGGALYDFGGNWNPTRKAWDLYGDGASDLAYSCCPVVRVGANYAIMPGDRRTQYSNADLGRIKIMPGGPGSTSLIAELNGAGNNGFAVDAFDTYEVEAYLGLKYRGFIFFTDWFARDINNFRGEKQAGGTSAPILYTANEPGSSTTFTALFRKGALFDFGMNTQIGYFVIPKKFEIAFRWDWIRGESGSPNGNGQIIGTQTVTTATGPVTANLLRNAFSVYQDANEYALGVNWYFKGQGIKWQTDLGFYTGGNPGGNGQSLTGFIPGVDGWLLRTQVQLWF